MKIYSQWKLMDGSLENDHDFSDETISVSNIFYELVVWLSGIFSGQMLLFMAPEGCLKRESFLSRLQTEDPAV